MLTLTVYNQINNDLELVDLLNKFNIKFDLNTNLPEPDNYYGTIKISGPDAKEFLQKQLTCDLQMVSEQPILGALCTQQGKVGAIFKIFKINNDFFIKIIKEQLSPTINDLRKYIFRSKVKVAEIINTFKQQLPTINQNTNEQLWEIQQIWRKIPEIYLITREQFLANNIDLITLGAVSLTKGCYRGQEIIARKQYLAKHKKHLKIIALSNYPESLPLIAGSKLTSPSVTIVRVVQLNKYNCKLMLVEAKITQNDFPII